MMRRLRVGIVGCGEVTQIMHLPSLSFLTEQFEVTALCDVSERVVQTVGAQWGVAKRYVDYRNLLEAGDTDVVLVASPDFTHAEVTLAAIAAGKHVLVEKPMCLTLAEADEISAAEQCAGLTVQVGYMRRYAPAFLEACRLVAGLGEIRLARAHDVLGQNALFVSATSRVVRGDDVPERIVAAGQKLRGERMAEALGEAAPVRQRIYSLMLNLSSHDISAMRDLLGMPQRVLYAAQRNGKPYLTAAFDYGKYICHYETGIDLIPRFECALEVYGETQELRLQYDTPYVRNLPIHVALTEANGSGGVVEHHMHPVWGDAFVAEWEAFHANVLARRAAKTSTGDYRLDLILFRDMINAMRD